LDCFAALVSRTEAQVLGDCNESVGSGILSYSSEMVRGHGSDAPAQGPEVGIAFRRQLASSASLGSMGGWEIIAKVRQAILAAGSVVECSI
jgi:hypothetical protein